MSKPIRILILEDLEADADLARREIRKVIKACAFQQVETQEDFIQALSDFQPDLILSDYHLPNFDGMKALALTLERAPFTPLIIWTGSLSEDIAVECMKAGANNYIIKENLQRLGPAVLHALEERHLLLKHEQAEDALKNSERRFRALIENGLDNISLLAADGTLLWESPAVFRTLDYAPDAFVGQDIFKLMHPDDLGWTRELYTKLIHEPGGRQCGVFRLRHSNGTWRWVEAIVTNMLEEPSVNAMVVNYRDITERKRAEEMSRRNEAILAQAEMMAHLGAWETEYNNLDDLNDNHLRWSEEVYRIFGYEPGAIEVTNDLFFQHVHPDDRQKIVEVMNQAVATQRPYELEHRIIRPDGTERIVLEHADITFNEQGQPLRMLGSVQDITERKQAEARINDLLVFNEKILNNSPIGILTYRLTGECVFANENAALIVGATVEELERQNFHDTEAWKRSGLYDLAEKAITSEAPVTSEIHHLSTFGKDVWITAYAVTFKSKDEDHLLLTVSDISERKQAEIDRQALLEIMQGLTNTNDLQEFLKLIHQSIGKVIYAENFFVVLYDENSGLFEEIYSVDQYDPPQPPSKLEKSITSYLFRIGEPLSVTDELFAELVVQGEVELVGTNSASWLGVPLKTSGGTIGVIAVQDYENPNRYSKHDQDFLASIAAQVALAIERKQAEDALRKAETRYRTLVEQLPAVTYLDLVDNSLESGEFTTSYLSPQVENLLGYAAEAFYNDPGLWTRLIHPDDRERVLTRNTEHYRNQGFFQDEYRMMTRNGREIWVRDEAIVVYLENDQQAFSQGVVFDITQRKQAEGALHKSEQRYRALFEDTPVSIWEEDFSEVKKHLDSLQKQGIDDLRAYFASHPDALFGCSSLIRIVDVNNTAVKMYKADSKEELIQSTIQVLSQGEQNHNLEDFIAIAAGKTSNAWEGADQTLTGDLIEVSLRWSVAPGYEEDFSKVIVTVIDITERKRVENELRASEERFVQLANNIREVFWMTDAESGKEIYMSPAAEEIWGWPHEYLMNQPDAFIGSILAEDLPVVTRALEKEKSGEKAEIEYRIVRPDGSVRWIWDRAFPIFDDTGEVKRIAGLSADITERKQAEEQLRKLSHSVEQSASTIVITDAAGVIEYVNPKFTETTGYTFEEAVGQNPRILKSGHTPPEEYQRLWETITSGQEWRGELHNKKKNGELYWEYVTISPMLNERGETSHFIAVKEDITQRKRNEEEITRHLIELEALYENGLAVGRLLQPREIGDRIIETFARYLSWHHVAIRLKRPESDELELIAFNQPGLHEQERASMESHFSSMVSKADQGLSGWAIQTGEALRTGNVHNHPQYVDTQEGIQSGLYMPLRVGDRIIGCISVESEVADAFTAQDERLLATLSNQAAIAFENARLYQSAQQELAERKRLQEQLNREHAQLKALFETIPDPIWLKDPQGKYLACNRVLETLIEIHEEQILGKTDYELLDEELARHFQEKDQEAIQRNIPMTYQEWVTYPNNKQPRLMEAVRTPLHDDEGNLIGVLGISHDITTMYNTQQELRESQELYRLLVETSPDGISILGLDGTIIFANQQLADLFGMDGPSDCIGTNFLSFIAPGQNPHMLELMEDTVPDGVVLQEYWMLRKDSSRFYGEARASLSLDKSGRPRWIIGQIRNITESKTAQETIQEERQRFLDLFENAPVAIWLEDFSQVMAWMEQLRIKGVTDLKGYLTKHPDQFHFALGLIRILNVNQAAVEMNGARSKTHLLENFHQLVRDAAPSSVMMHELEMLWKGRTSFEFEMTNRRLDDALTTGILHVYVPVKNEKPDYARVIIASTDITERVNTEKALQTSETHYRELADSITDVFFEMDADLHYVYWNKASESLTGILAKDAIGKSMREIFGETEEQVRIQQIYENVLNSHQPKTFETVLTLENRQHVFEINAYPSTRGVSVVAKDVAERKRSETIMQKRFELMEYSAHHSLEELIQKVIDEVSQLTDSMIGFLHFVRADQNTLGLQTWSTSTLQQFGVPLSEGTHRPMDQAGVWADAVRERRSVIHNDYASLPNRKGLPEGHAPVIREMVIPIIRNEKTVAVLGLGNRPTNYTQLDREIAERFTDYAWDITERKQMEIALADERNQLAKRVEERAADLIRANTNLARALRVKDEFLANMSHELRTPLNAILGLSESLGEQIAGPLNEKQQKYITTISESGRHLLALINDILDLAKIEAGQITLDINRVDIQSVCEASLRMIKQMAQKKHQDVRLDIDDDIGLIWADERRLKQMIVNLLSNAVKFTPEDGKIGLEVRGDQAENEVIITVWDNGIGMKEEDLSRLFQPFVQLDSGLARESTGTGLGLALVAQMVRLHGGSVRVESLPEQGSRFTIVLPWEPALALDPSTKMKITGKFRAVKPDPNNRSTILLIEDTNEVIMMIRDYLELAGYAVVIAKDGVEGITQAQLVHPDLILMDVMMPRMDGLEATRRLRSEPDFANTPIIALTALAMPSDRERCISAGMNDYMSKPVNLKELVKTIQRFLVSKEEVSS